MDGFGRPGFGQRIFATPCLLLSSFGIPLTFVPPDAGTAATRQRLAGETMTAISDIVISETFRFARVAGSSMYTY